MIHFLHVRETPSFSLLHLQLWQVTVHLRETDRDLKLTYADEAKARAVAKRIAKKLHEKVLRREDVVKEEVRLENRDPTDYKLVWYKKVLHQGEPAFIAMKDYVFVEDAVSTTTILA